jgi:hypothetical protein
MARIDCLRATATRGGVRLLVSTLAVLLLPPFIAVAIVPLALLLFPVAWLAIPFIVTTLLGDALASSESKPKPVALQASRTKLAPGTAVGGARAS